MSDLIRRVLPEVDEHLPAFELRYEHRGRLVAMETPAALYVGTLKSIIFHTFGDVGLTIERDGFEARTNVKPEVLVWVAKQERGNNDTAS